MRETTKSKVINLVKEQGPLTYQNIVAKIKGYENMHYSLGDMYISKILKDAVIVGEIKNYKGCYSGEMISDEQVAVLKKEQRINNLEGNIEGIKRSLIRWEEEFSKFNPKIQEFILSFKDTAKKTRWGVSNEYKFVNEKWDKFIEQNKELVTEMVKGYYGEEDLDVMKGKIDYYNINYQFENYLNNQNELIIKTKTLEKLKG